MRHIGWLNDVKVEPLGLLYIASFLRHFGHEVELHDTYVGEDAQAFVDQVTYWKPQIVGCAVHTINEEFCFTRARLTKQLDPRIIFVAGGPHATCTAKRMLTRCPEIDLIAHQESEETMVALAQRVAQGRDYYDVPGISFRIASAVPRQAGGVAAVTTPLFGNVDAGGTIVTNAFQPLKTPLDELQFPAKDLLANKYYEKYQATAVITARGCAYRCDFCVSPMFFKGVREGRIALVAEELRQVMAQRAIRHVRFYDDVFAFSVKKIRAVKEHIAPLGLTFDCYVRVDVTTPEMLELMQESGC